MNAVLLSLAFLLAGLVILFIITKIAPKIIRHLSWKTCALTAGVYLGLSLLSYPLLCRLPAKDLIQSTRQRDETAAAAQSLLAALYRQQPGLNEETLAHSKGVYKNSSRSLPVSSGQLSLNILGSSGTPHIFIEKKGTADGRIDVSTYITAHFIGKVDFSKQLLPPTILLKADTLQVIFPGLQTMNYQQINADFTLRQFKTGGNSDNTTSSRHGEQFVYIRIPANIQLNINQDQGLIHEIN